MNAIEVAFHYDDKVLVEEGVENLIEVTLPIMGNDMLQFASIERPLNKSEMFDFNDKYLSGGKKRGGANSEYSEIPAKIDEGSPARSMSLGKNISHAWMFRYGRVDFLIEGSLESLCERSEHIAGQSVSP